MTPFRECSKKLIAQQKGQIIGNEVKNSLFVLARRNHFIDSTLSLCPVTHTYAILEVHATALWRHIRI